jgi:ribonuclease R
MRSLPGDFYVHEEKQHALIGRRTGRVYRLGAAVTVTIAEADGLTGSSVFNLVGDRGADIPGIKFAKSNIPLPDKKKRDIRKKIKYKKRRK